MTYETVPSLTTGDIITASAWATLHTNSAVVTGLYRGTNTLITAANVTSTSTSWVVIDDTWTLTYTPSTRYAVVSLVMFMATIGTATGVGVDIAVSGVRVGAVSPLGLTQGKTYTTVSLTVLVDTIGLSTVTVAPMWRGYAAGTYSVYSDSTLHNPRLSVWEILP